MKNKFLLLSATALLSTGALMANADELYRDSATIKAHINLYESSKISVIRDMEFGTLIGTGNHTDTIINLNATDDDLDIEGDGVTTAGDDFHTAYIALNVPEGYKATLTLPSEFVKLENSLSKTNIYMMPEAVLDDAVTYGDYTIQYFSIGGSIDVGNHPFNGEFRGTFTVTAVVKEDPDYDPEP